jgi:hypothetical protein
MQMHVFYQRVRLGANACRTDVPELDPVSTRSLLLLTVERHEGFSFSCNKRWMLVERYRFMIPMRGRAKRAISFSFEGLMLEIAE